MSRTISLGTKRSGVGVATRSSLVRLRVVFAQVFLVIVYFDVILWLLRFSTDEEAAVGKQHCERLGAYEQGLFVSLFTIKFFFFLIKTHRERGGSNPSSRPLPFALSHFCDKMFNVFLKKMSFFLWFSARKTFCTFESSNSCCCFFAMFFHRYNSGSCSIFALFLLII